MDWRVFEGNYDRRGSLRYVVWDGAEVRALDSHQYDPGSIPRLGVICGLSLLVLYSAPRGFLRVLRFLSLLKKPAFDLICASAPALEGLDT